MTLLRVKPGKPLMGELASSETGGYPGDKSISHRSALFASLAEGDSLVRNFQISGVTAPMLNALSAVDIDWKLDGNNLRVRGQGFTNWKNPHVPIDCGNSATTIRLLAGAFSALGVDAILDGSAGLRRRPMGRIVNPLQKMGVKIKDTNGCAPLILNNSFFPLSAGEYPLTVASAQVKSCLLLAGLRAGGKVVITEPAASRDHTERMLGSMGVAIEIQSSQSRQEGSGVKTILTPPDHLSLRPLDIDIPGDFSAASFLIVAACITPGSNIIVRGVGLNPTRTGLLDALNGMGASIEIFNQHERSREPIGDLRIHAMPLQAIKISGDDVVRMIDEFPAFAIAAIFASGVTEVRDAAELRYKESDRIADLCVELSSLGIDFQELPDGFRLGGGKPVSGGTVNPHGDHRLAMAFAILGLASDQDIVIENAEIINESFPSFVESFGSLGADFILTDPK